VLFRSEFFLVIRELTAAGTTVIISSHILTELEARTDLAAIMREGKLVAHGDLDTLRREAGLPLTVRAKGDVNAIARCLNGAFAKTILPDEREIDIDCPVPQKMALLRTLTTLGDACADVEIRLPSLDDLYLHYSGRKIAVSGPRAAEAS
jgi:Cu-processing system ATP-binding protein